MKTSRRVTYIWNGMLTLSRAAMRQLCFIQEMAHIDQANLMHISSHSLITFVSLFFFRDFIVNLNTIIPEDKSLVHHLHPWPA